jgi:hypothetical protein
MKFLFLFLVIVLMALSPSATLAQNESGDQLSPPVQGMDSDDPPGSDFPNLPERVEPSQDTEESVQSDESDEPSESVLFPTNEDVSEDESDWGGPRMEMAYSRYRIGDGQGAGGVHAFTFGGFLPTGRFLIAAHAEFGVREYALASNDVVVGATGMFGYQHLPGFYNRIVPYGAVTTSVGAIFSKRFHTPRSSFVKGFGFELGAHFRLLGSMWAGIGMGYRRTQVLGLGYNQFVIRLRIGL